MSLISAAGASVPSGSLHLFTGATPAGYEAMSGIHVPASLFTAPRFALIEHSVEPGNIALSAVTTGFWLDDYASSDCVYQLFGGVLRRLNVITGYCEQLATAPVTTATAAIGTRHGLYVYAPGTGIASVAGKAIYRYDPASNTWSQVVSLPAVGYFPALVYREVESAVYVLGGSNASSLSSSGATLATTIRRHDLLTNSTTLVDVELPAGTAGAQANLVGDSVVVTGGTSNANYVLNAGWAAAESLPAWPDTASAQRGALLATLSSTELTAITLAGRVYKLDISAVATGWEALGTIHGLSGLQLRHGRTGTTVAGANPARPLTDGLLLCQVGTADGPLAVLSTRSLGRAPRGTLVFARKV